MTADAAWLRARPEIVGLFAATLADRPTNSENAIIRGAHSALVSILPLLRAAIRADAVRELAGNINEKWVEQYIRDWVTQDEHARDRALGLVLNQRATAHAQGRAAGREEAARVEDAKAQELRRIGFCNVEALLADNIATAIRSLP